MLNHGATEIEAQIEAQIASTSATGLLQSKAALKQLIDH